MDNALITPLVRVCFDTSVQLAPGVANGDFDLTGVDVRNADRRSPFSVTQDPDNTSCIKLAFTSNVNIGSYTVLEIANDVVRPAGGAPLGNIESAARLDNTDVVPVIGRIGGPNLVSTIPVDVGGGPGAGAVQYNFDKVIEPAGIVAGRFGYFGPDGEFELGDGVFNVSGKSVIITFTGLAGDDPTPQTATRFFALSGAVDLADRTAAVNSNRAEAIGGAVPGRPTLLSATKVAGTQGVYDLRYDQQINPGTLSDCRASLSVGPSFGASASQVILDGKTLRVTFAGLTPAGGADVDSDLEVVRITDEGVPAMGGCATDRNTARGSVTSSVALRLGDNIPGFTSGPDLTGCTGSPSTNEVTFFFDELLSNFPGLPTAADFEIKSTTGGSQDGQTIRDRTDNTVTVIFAAGALVNGAACHVERGTVVDRDPNSGYDLNPSGTVRLNSDGTTPIGIIPVGEGTVFVPVPGPTVTVTNTVPGPPSVATGIVRKTPQSLTLNARCRPLGGGRYRCSVSGKLTQANSVRALGRAKACTGTVKVQYKSGTKTVSTRLARIKQSTCTYKGTVTFTKPERLRSGLKVRARYNGNKYAKVKHSRTVFVISR